MFLATTALEEFWDKDQKILFAGEWCRLYEDRDKFKKLNYEIFPYQWSDSSDKDTALKDIDKVYKKAIASLTKELNKHLGINENERYYSIIMGYWLTKFIHTNYDKFALLTRIKNQYNNKLKTKILEKDRHVVPIDLKEYSALIRSDIYNLQEYSNIAVFLKIESESVKAKYLTQKYTFLSQKKYRNHIFFTLLNLFKKPEICISAPYFTSLTSYLKIWNKSHNIVFQDFSFNVSFKMTKDYLFREKFLNFECSTSFESYISEHVLRSIPLVFVEGHRNLINEIEKQKIPNSRLYYSAVGIYENLIYKFFIASQSNIIKIINHQHGAGYGTDFECCDENYDLSVSDRFFTFGWSESAQTSYLPFEKLNIHHKNNNSKNTTLFLTDGHRYIDRILYISQTSQLIETSVNSVANFLEKVNDKSIRVRFYPDNPGWDIRQRIKDKTNRFTEAIGVSFDKEFDRSKIIISEHMGTTFYEAISCNKPVIVFIDINVYKIRESAVSYFNELEKVGVLHYSVDSAVNHYLLIRNDIENWWADEFLQNTVKKFSYQFARTSPNWSGHFVSGIQKELISG